MGTTQRQAHKERPAPPPAQLAFQRRLLLGLNMVQAGFNTRKHIYGGTVPPSVRAKRHAKAKAAKRARRLNRSR